VRPAPAPVAVEPAPAPKAEAKPAPAPKVEAKPPPAPKAEAKPAPAPKAEAKPAPAPKAEAKPAPAPKAEAKVEAAPKPEAKHAEPPKAEEDGKKSKKLADVAKAAVSGGGRMLRADMRSTDKAAYVARAIANNRDPSLITGEEGMNEAEDGEKYWGPLDNESSRAKAAGQLLAIDQFECISCGTCVEQTNRVFYLPVDGKATPIAQDGPMDLIQDAIEACPVTCIHWLVAPEVEERGLATGVGEDWSDVVNNLPAD